MWVCRVGVLRLDTALDAAVRLEPGTCRGEAGRQEGVHMQRVAASGRGSLRGREARGRAAIACESTGRHLAHRVAAQLKPFSKRSSSARTWRKCVASIAWHIASQNRRCRAHRCSPT